MGIAEELAEKYRGMPSPCGYAHAFESVVRAINEAIERCALAAENERVDEEDTGEAEEFAYNCALGAAAAKIRALKSEPTVKE